MSVKRDIWGTLRIASTEVSLFEYFRGLRATVEKGFNLIFLERTELNKNSKVYIHDY